MPLTFAFDRLIGQKPVPNLVQDISSVADLQSRDLDNTFPRTVVPRILLYLRQARIDYATTNCLDAPHGSWYVINFGWFDFSIDYMAMISESTRNKVRDGSLNLIFYYHEGDAPGMIRSRLESLALIHDIDPKCFLLVSANSMALDIKGCVYFDDHERFFDFTNRFQSVDPAWKLGNRSFDFTLLNRRHKWWRATITADLHRYGVLDRSLWSYDTVSEPEDIIQENPISLFEIPGLRAYMPIWLANGPHRCDGISRDQQHRFSNINTGLYTKSWLHLIVESQFEVDRTPGTFITEKTYKCMKYGQPFVVIGPQGTLQQLRRHGYKVFDDVLDNTYDTISDSTKRWEAIKKLIINIESQDIGQIWARCQPDVEHNLRHFQVRRRSSLLDLCDRIHGYFTK